MKTLTPKESFCNNQEYDFNYFDITCEFTNIHNHEFYEFFLVIYGEGTHEVNNSDHCLESGTFVCLRPEDTHTFKVKKGDKMRILNLAFCLEIANVVLSLLDLDAHLSFNIETPSTTTKLPDEPIKTAKFTEITNTINSINETHTTTTKLPDEPTKTTKLSDEPIKTTKLAGTTDINSINEYSYSTLHHQLMQEQAKEIVDQYQSFLANEHRKDILTPLLKIFFSQLISKSVFSDLKEKQNENSIPTWLKKAISGLQMKENYENGLDYLLVSTGKNQSYLCRMFQKHLGCSPSEYINSVRLKNACNLLRYTKISIADICYDCGFSSISHFNHLFKKTYDQSPSGYRKKR